MKKIFVLLFMFTCFLFSGVTAKAQDITGYIPHKVIVKFMDDFSTNNPPKTFMVSLNETCVVKETKTVEQGAILFLETTKVSKEKRGKINASVSARITKIYIPSQAKTIDISKLNPNAIVKFSQYEKLDKVDKTLDVGISAANFFVKNVTYPAHFVKGAIKNETGNRLKSAVKETFDSSVLSYTTEGKPLNLKNGDLATLTYFTKDVAVKNPTDDSTEAK